MAEGLSQSAGNTPQTHARCSSSERNSLRAFELLTQYHGYIESDDDSDSRCEVTSILQDYYRFKYIKAGRHNDVNFCRDYSTAENDLTSSNESDEYLTAQEVLTSRCQQKGGWISQRTRFYTRLNRRYEEFPTITYRPPLRVPRPMFDKSPTSHYHSPKPHGSELTDRHQDPRLLPSQVQTACERSGSHHEIEPPLPPPCCNERRENGFAYIAHNKAGKDDDKNLKSVRFSVCPLCLSPYRGKLNLYKKLEMWKKDCTCINKSQKSYTSVNEYPQVIHSDAAKDMNINPDDLALDGFSAFVYDKINGPLGKAPPTLQLKSPTSCAPLKVMNPSNEDERSQLPLKERFSETTDREKSFGKWDDEAAQLSHYLTLPRKDSPETETNEEKLKTSSQLSLGERSTKAPSITEKHTSRIKRHIGRSKVCQFVDLLFCGQSSCSRISKNPLTSQEIVLQQLKELGSEIYELDRASKRKKLTEDDKNSETRTEQKINRIKRPLSDSFAFLLRRNVGKKDPIRPLSSSHLEEKQVGQGPSDNILQILRKSRIPVRSNVSNLAKLERRGNPSSDRKSSTSVAQNITISGSQNESRIPSIKPKLPGNEKVARRLSEMNPPERFSRRAGKVSALQAHAIPKGPQRQPVQPVPKSDPSGKDTIPKRLPCRRPLLDQAYINRSYRIMTELKRSAQKASVESSSRGTATRKSSFTTVPLSSQNLARHNSNQTPRAYKGPGSTSTSDFVMNRVSNIAQPPPVGKFDKLKGILTRANARHSPPQSPS